MKFIAQFLLYLFVICQSSSTIINLFEVESKYKLSVFDEEKKDIETEKEDTKILASALEMVWFYPNNKKEIFQYYCFKNKPLFTLKTIIIPPEIV